MHVYVCSSPYTQSGAGSRHSNRKHLLTKILKQLIQTTSHSALHPITPTSFEGRGMNDFGEQT